MTIYDYVLAQVDARAASSEEPLEPMPSAVMACSTRGQTMAQKAPANSRISIAGDLGGRAYTQRDARRKWARAA